MKMLLDFFEFSKQSMRPCGGTIIILHAGMVSIIIGANTWVSVALIALLPHPWYPLVLS